MSEARVFPNFSYTLRQLRYFTIVVESGSVAEASRRLNISQPSVSLAIKTLEENFSTQLFIRHHASGVSLTPSGLRFYRQALDLLRQARELEQSVFADSNKVGGQIEVGCFETIAPLYIPRLLAGFRQRYPNVRIHVQDGVQSDLLAGLENGAFDLVLLYDLELGGAYRHAPLLPGLRPHVLLPEKHRFADRASISLRQVVEEPLILLDVPPSGKYFCGLFQEVGLEPNVTHRSPSVELVRGMVGQGLGYSVLVTKPSTSLTYDGNSVVAVPLLDDVKCSDLVAAWLQRSRLTKLAQIFIHFCQEELGTSAAVSAA
ncbi:LysR substrate-binding domain-containing protein [Rhodospirillaceae bacterium SYSU D60014]|uniref:LysR substrate-binding domain-containing protein n=1 Tax=Virgifigura deserti TaxID=2268457 RepID=UPI000E66F3C7